jgi:uncharacterized protein
MSIIPRNHYSNLANSLKERYPCLAILGPRQCGKTTFAKECFRRYEYLDLELPSDYAKIEGDPELFLTSRKNPLVIDEAQRMPELFPILRAIIDRRRKTNGQFILLGSSSFQLQEQISESLSGRISFLDFHPFHIGEVYPEVSLKSHWLKGGFPDALLEGKKDKLNFSWFEFYTRTLIERDLPNLGIEMDNRQFRRLWKMATHFHGDILNKNKIATSLGISPHTVDRYLNTLEQTFALRLLPPFFANIKKRLVKSPKLYFRDSGMFHYFSDVRTLESLVGSPHLGASFEGYVVEQILQRCTPNWEGFFFRSSDGTEVDLLLNQGDHYIPIEIKSTLKVNKTHGATVEKVLDLLGQKRGFVVNLSDDEFPLSKRVTCIGVENWIANGFSEFWSHP